LNCPASVNFPGKWLDRYTSLRSKYFGRSPFAEISFQFGLEFHTARAVGISGSWGLLVEVEIGAMLSW
jgi:hypothetical protein